jgi:class 3 adenylate cyclase
VAKTAFVVTDALREKARYLARRQTVAVLFVDIVGLIRMAKRMPPERLPVAQYRKKVARMASASSP